METSDRQRGGRQTGWSPRMLRYIEHAGLVVPARTTCGYRVYGLRELNQLRSLRELRRRFGVELADLAFAARLRREPALRAAVDDLAGRQPAAATALSSGSSASTSGSWPRELDRRERGADGDDEAIRREGSGAGARGRPAHRVGRPADAGAGRDPRALRARAAAGRLPHLGLPARDDRDGEPGAHAEGRRRGRRALRLEPALDAGRRGRGAGRGVRHLRLRDQGRGQRHLLRAHRGGGRPQAAPDDGRRRRRDRRPPRAPPRAARRRHRRHRGDDHRRHPAEGARARRRARLPGHRRQRGEDEAPVRQPLRHRPVDDRRHHPRDQRPARRPSTFVVAGYGWCGRGVASGRRAWART